METASTVSKLVSKSKSWDSSVTKRWGRILLFSISHSSLHHIYRRVQRSLHSYATLIEANRVPVSSRVAKPLRIPVNIPVHFLLNFPEHLNVTTLLGPSIISHRLLLLDSCPASPFYLSRRIYRTRWQEHPPRIQNRFDGFDEMLDHFGAFFLLESELLDNVSMMSALVRDILNFFWGLIGWNLLNL